MCGRLLWPFWKLQSVSGWKLLPGLYKRQLRHHGYDRDSLRHCFKMSCRFHRCPWYQHGDRWRSGGVDKSSDEESLLGSGFYVSYGCFGFCPCLLEILNLPIYIGLNKLVLI
jgi:hypothetical protein